VATPHRLRHHAGATGRPLGILLWCVQAFLALVFVSACWAKLTLLATIMLGALTTHLFILHVPPATPGVLLLMSAFVVWGRR
jgi:hypothetical protein